MKTAGILLISAILLSGVGATFAADWPQWRGPDRDEISREKGLLKKWPAAGPRVLWTFNDAGTGYSGIAVVGNRLFTMGADSSTENVYAIDVETHKKVWSTPIAARFSNGWGDGPRGTPTVDGDLLYAMGGQGELVCVESVTGKKIWHVNMRKDLGGDMMSGWGYTESPLVDGNHIICTPGGAKGTLAALDKKTGKVAWRSKAFTDKAAYSSVVMATVCGIKQYVQLTGNNVFGIAADDGRLLWSYPHQTRTAAIPTPIVFDDCVFVSSGYGTGCTLVKLTPSGNEIKAEKVYANKNMTNHHGGVVRVGDYLYGYSDGKGWVCQEFKTGNTAWESKKLGKGCVTYADGGLYCYAENDGTVVLIDASPQGWNERGRFKLPKETQLDRKKGKIWTHPVVANGRLFLRDQDLMFCLDVKEQAAKSR